MDSPNIIMPPSPEIVRLAALLEIAIGQLLLGLRTDGPSGKWEAEIEAQVLFTLIVRHAEGVTELARRDLVLLPPAMTVARAAFETSVKALWILHPDNPYARESRWLCYLKSEETYGIRIADRLRTMGIDGEQFRDTAHQIRDFRVGVETMLPDGYTAPSELPNFEGMINSLEFEKWYIHYMAFSQFSHGTRIAGNLYRRHLGTKKVMGEFIAPSDWYHPIGASSMGVIQVGRRLIEVCGGSPDRYLNPGFLHEFQELLDALKSLIGTDSENTNLEDRD